jgi:hypothetical protein
MKRDSKKHIDNKSFKDTKDFQLTALEEEESQLADPLLYPTSDDIYSRFIEEKNIDPEDITKTKNRLEILGKGNEKEFNEDMVGDDLDIPGSELDDEQEKIGSEDEENNYYSLGGDNHNDLEED